MRKFILAFSFGWLWICTIPATTWAIRIEYNVRPIPPTKTEWATTAVRITVSDIGGDKSIAFQMPVWSPGDYHRQDHGQYVRNAHAQTHTDRALPLTERDFTTWTVDTQGEKAIEFSYAVPNCPPGLFSENVKVTEKYAFYNCTALYMYVVGHKTDPIRLIVSLPSDWPRAVTPLQSLPDDSTREKFAFVAPNYDTLADSPVLAGTFETREFTVASRPHIAAFFNNYQKTDFDGTVSTLQKVVTEENRLMGGPPYERYIFFLDVGGMGGGLEHLNSCRMSWPSRAVPRFTAGLAAHEFFHLWNVKRIRPEVLGPFDYLHLPKTRNLWFAEGVTSYFGDLTVLRTGVETEADYLSSLAASISSLQHNPARLRVTADESSLRVAESRYSEGYGGLSYYLKGELIGLCLDLKIRGVTQNKQSLETVMRDLMTRSGLPKPGYPEDGIRDAVIRAAGPEIGVFYDRIARSTDEMPFTDCLHYAGLRLESDAAGFYRISADPNAAPEQVALKVSWLSGH